MKKIYVSQADNRSWGTSPAAFEGLNYPAVVPDNFTGGAMTHNRFTDEWVRDEPHINTHEDDVMEAEANKIILVSEAERFMSGWVVDLTLGTISKEDKASLVAWRTYTKILKDVDTSSAPNIDWPDKPA
ncbi:tail fiber assembly protein [Trabulsiella odontotermitis]|uniref:Tail fiber assembly protein n=1 Tax=Trabulsiella odontotermitis TaxID=379893 RepID=A0A0L0GHH4_9ENTR|nr:tail fiber assembly protein [Trabulsiella odontotermitis]KNC88314.1 hypothetical protein GM31_11390 [Trabulsiella odontotermitis]